MEKTKEEIIKEIFGHSFGLLHPLMDIPKIERCMEEYRSLPKEQEQEIERLNQENERLLQIILNQQQEIERLKEVIQNGCDVYEDDVKDLRSQITELEAKLKDGELHFAQWYSEMQDKKALSAEPKEAQPEEQGKLWREIQDELSKTFPSWPDIESTYTITRK